MPKSVLQSDASYIANVRKISGEVGGKGKSCQIRGIWRRSENLLVVELTHIGYGINYVSNPVINFLKLIFLYFEKRTTQYG